jgi:hypothetical protein
MRERYHFDELDERKAQGRPMTLAEKQAEMRERMQAARRSQNPIAQAFRSG